MSEAEMHRMGEGELEAAICRAFPILLADLHGEGYRIRSSQAILLGRRIDLLLEARNGLTCIVELKAGAPPMPHVRDQILDYAECWKLSYPSRTTPRLIVIGNAIPKKTEAELANFGIEARAISVATVLEALQKCTTETSAPTGLKLDPDNVTQVRHLLSDYNLVNVPDGLVFAPPWNHNRVFLALVKRGEKHKDLWKKDIYVQLYRQKPNCAVLYGPSVENAKRGPLHFNPRALSWNEESFLRIKPSVEYVQTDNKGPGRDRGNFDWYRVGDWDRFAASVGL